VVFHTVAEKDNYELKFKRLGIHRRAQVLLLGTFHFDYPNLDAYRPEHRLDILSESRQAEVQDIVERLEAFEPTTVAVERRVQDEAVLLAEYQAYREGTFALPRSEVYQLGFQVAARCDHSRLYPIDEWGRLYDSWDTVAAHCLRLLGLPERQYSPEELENAFWQAMSRSRAAAFLELLRERDADLVETNLRQRLLFENSLIAMRFGHGAYLSWTDSAPGDYVLADHVTGWWYNRNLRIFSNLKRLAVSPYERILVIIGAGHLPILRHAVQCSWDLELAEAEWYLEGYEDP